MGISIFKNLTTKIYDYCYSLENNNQEIKITNDSKCLLLAPHPGDELIGCGGLLLKYPTQFDVYCLTNDFNSITAPLTYEEKVAIRKKEFLEIMEKIGVNYYHFFDDIDDKRLKMRYDRFKTISLSDYDYIFIPNIMEKPIDYKVVSLMLNELLQDRPYKKNVKIVMYETQTTLAKPNAYANIEDTITKKLETIKLYKSQTQNENLVNAIKGLNTFRGFVYSKQYAEAYSILDINNFRKICKIYSI